MTPAGAALYLDFDNVFSGLLELDPKVARQFAEDPGWWVARLKHSLLADRARRWLVLRCYMNPAGSLPDPLQGGSRLFFSRFRPFFTRAGFDVIDCPRITATKNGADIRMVIDVLDSLGGTTRYDEYVIASGDSDMTPLLIRLRAADRRTTVLSAAEAAEGYGVVADLFVDGEDILELLQVEPRPADGRAEPPAGEAEAPDVPAEFRELVTRRYDSSSGPVPLAALGQELRAALGPGIDATNWFGHRSCRRAISSLGLPNAHLDGQFLWDPSRHPAPVPAADGPSPAAPAGSGPSVPQQAPGLPAAVARLTTLLKLPRLPRDAWPAIYHTLAEYARTHEFGLTEATRWSRDALSERGTPVSRTAVGFVIRAAMFGGCPLTSDPAPDADALARATVGNVLSRAATAAYELTDTEVVEVRSWLGDPAAAASGT
ncbi:MAG: NYN domain-containing protein [Propionicimonas sp.]|nr:NYN domain-containing protein [Propionicimonas sp.]